MASSSEIEKLERKWKENPKGTVFAPFAEALRKHGQLAQARDVLRQGLQNHPEYVPGNIVLGRCCLDLGEDGAAENAFGMALKLDAENVIALKALADITERQGRLAEAVSWLNQLISVDPSNDEARDQLARIDAAREQAAMMISAAGTLPSEEESPQAETPPAPPAMAAASGEISDEHEPVADPNSPTAPMPSPVARAAPAGRPYQDQTVPMVPTFSAPRPAPAPAPPPPAPEPEPLELESVQFEPPAAAAASTMQDLESHGQFAPPDPGDAAAAPPGLEPSDVVSLSEVEAPAIELQPAGSSEFQVPDAVSDLGLRAGSGEFQVPDASADLANLAGSGGTEYQTPSGADELLAMASTAGTAGFQPQPADLPLIDVSAEAEEPAAVDPGVDTPSISELPTETFETAPSIPAAVVAPAAAAGADLRLIYPDQAPAAPPRVRRISDEARASAAVPAVTEVGEAELRDPEPILTESMAEVYAGQGHYTEALAVYRQLVAGAPGDARLRAKVREFEGKANAQVASRRPTYLATVTGGESVESFFRGLVQTRPGAPEPPPSLAGPAGAAERAGAETAGAGAPTRPASDPLSLSALFGEDASPVAPPGPARPAAQGDSYSFDQFFSGNPAPSPSSGATPSIRNSRALPPSDEDLDQFQNWLKGLKK
jgi:tetratricopeptide repeat protein